MRRRLRIAASTAMRSTKSPTARNISDLLLWLVRLPASVIEICDWSFYIQVFILKLFEAFNIEVLASSGFHFISKMILRLWRMLFLCQSIPGWTFLFAEMLLPPQNNPWMSVSPCRDASASAEESLDERFSLQRCFCLRKIIPRWVFLLAEMLLQTLFVSDQFIHIYPNRFVQYPTGLLGVWFCRIQSLTGKVFLVWQSRVRFRTVPFLFFFILYSAATIISAAGFLILELYRHLPSTGFLIFGLCKLFSVAVFLKILRLDLISIDDYLPLCLCMTGVVW